jgi:NAD(P)-dependent dehydrogenase (short-subunit alcohol dehydrogenase family)
MRAKEEIVAVTAGASGIGRVVTESFLQRGSIVYVCDVDAAALALAEAEAEGALPTADQAPSTSDETASSRGTAHWIRADVSRYEDVQSFFARIAEDHGRLDVLVNNAGIAGPTAPAEAVDPADWDRTIEVNLNGQFYCAREAIPLLRAAGGGSMVHMASNAAFSGFPLRAPYTASKWAVIGLTKTLAMELGVDKIRVNAICPGSVSGARIDRVIESDAEKRGMTADQIRDVYLRQSSMRVFASAQDVANTILFLTSPEGGVISGQVIGLDGHTETLANWLD